MNVAEFFAMGGYGAYVWSSFALTFVLMIWTLIKPILETRKILRSIAQQNIRGQQQ